MAWKKGKLLKGRKPYKTWSKNPRTIDTPRARSSEHGGTVLYRNHVQAIDSRLNHQELADTYFNLPPSLGELVKRYESEDYHGDDPPLIAFLRKTTRDAWQSSTRGQGVDMWNHMVLRDGHSEKLFFMFSGSTGYFIHQDLLMGITKRSVKYTTDHARAKLKQSHDPVRVILWVETIHTDTG